jgi:hypothetical protein
MNPRICKSGVALFVCILALCGCGGPQRGEVSGNVTFAGKPLPAGRIYFTPDFTKGNDGPQGFADIRDGMFDTRVGGKGSSGGPMIVVIRGYDGIAGDTPGSLGKRLFMDFQIPVELPKEDCTRDFEVPASAADHLPKGPRGGKKL